MRVLKMLWSVQILLTVFVDTGTQDSDIVTLTFDIGDGNDDRMWEIKVT